MRIGVILASSQANKSSLLFHAVQKYTSGSESINFGCREDDQDVLFIDASKGFEKVKNQNKLRSEDIEKIVNTYANREEIEKYSHKATLEEIGKKFGVTKECVRQTEIRALNKLKNMDNGRLFAYVN